jgi:phosphoglycerate dehydrogenase-like enzyme
MIGPRGMKYNPSIILKGKIALFLGYGSIGMHVGKILKDIGLQVFGIKRKPIQDKSVNVFPIESLPDLLPQTDILIISMPLTPDNEGLIGDIELNLLPQGAILINGGRGSVVDQKALYQKLKSGHIGGAGLDVWYNYPGHENDRSNTNPADFPFHELSNIVMSPHRGGGAKETEKHTMIALANSLNTAIKNEPIPHLVNKDGY